MSVYDDIERNEWAMAKVVRLRCSVALVGGGDYEGDVERQVADDKFVWTHKKAELGWCFGVHMAHIAQQLLGTDSVSELVAFKKAVVSCVDEVLDDLRNQLDNLANKPNE